MDGGECVYNCLLYVTYVTGRVSRVGNGLCFLMGLGVSVAVAIPYHPIGPLDDEETLRLLAPLTSASRNEEGRKGNI
jgi:hypothetical protein